MQYADVAAALSATGLRVVSAAPVALRGRAPGALVIARSAERREPGGNTWEVFRDWEATGYFRGQASDARLAEFVAAAVAAVKTLDYMPESITSEYMDAEGGFRNAVVYFTTWLIEDA